MPKQQKIFSLILLLAGLSAVLYAAYPQKALELKDMVLSQLGQKEPTGVLGSGAEGGVNLLQAEFKSSIDEISSQASQIIADKIEENKDLPLELKEKAEEELEKQVYQQVCEQWLKED